MIAIVSIKRDPTYRRDAFVNGLRRAGYKIVEGGKPSSRADLMVMWNRQGAAESNADTWEQVGGSVLVVENGYIGVDEKHRSLYAISIHGHNGSGWFPVGDEDRFGALHLTPKPWHSLVGPTVVCGQRGIGSREMKSPAQWEQRTAQRLTAMRRPFRLRRHPGLVKPKTTLDGDLADAACCLVWSSSSGVRALIEGVPVVYAAPHWICAQAASKWPDGFDRPVRDDEKRLAALRHMAWGQRTVQEIETGEVFVRIRERLHEAKW